jgi:hypothetical protein
MLQRAASNVAPLANTLSLVPRRSQSVPSKAVPVRHQHIESDHDTQLCLSSAGYNTLLTTEYVNSTPQRQRTKFQLYVNRPDMSQEIVRHQAG